MVGLSLQIIYLEASPLNKQYTYVYCVFNQMKGKENKESTAFPGPPLLFPESTSSDSEEMPWWPIKI